MTRKNEETYETLKTNLCEIYYIKSLRPKTKEEETSINKNKNKTNKSLNVSDIDTSDGGTI